MVKGLMFWIAKLPMRKPLALFALLFAWFTAWGVLIAAVAGVLFEAHVLGFLQAVIICTLGPILGYYFTSTYEAVKTDHEEGSNVNE